MKRPWIAVSIVTALVGAGVAGVASADSDTAEAGFDFGNGETVAEGLELPWGMDFLPDGSALFAQRDTAEIKQVKPGGEAEVVATLDEVQPNGEGGLLGLAVSPTYDEDKFVYVYYTTGEDNRVARLTLDNPAPEVIIDGIPRASIHNGGRLEFGPDGKLYATTGDASNGDNSQDPQNLGGKILRVNPDGSVPDDNPTEGSPVYTLGHRNVQGIAWTKEGQAFASELGQNTWDEVNKIEAGKNYGWPEVEGEGGEPEYVDPIVTWPTSEASPSGAEIVGDTMFVAALRGERLWLVPHGGGDPTAVLEGEVGRIRTVELGPDGYLWIATANGSDDKILRYPPE